MSCLVATSFMRRGILHKQATLAQLSWYQHIALLEKVNDSKIRLWHTQKSLKHGWSRDIRANCKQIFQ
jgi:DUF1016 N-terminal domain